MSNYPRSVLLRLAGALVSIALWLGLILLALANMDIGGLTVPEGLRAGWPFWVGAAVLILIVFLTLRRAAPGPGWGTFLIGLVIPEVAFFINRLAATEIGMVFWIATAALILVPLPSRKAAVAPAR
ncbi:MAG TPA: hypothetical protein VFY46_05140 [Acidimicrobiia bacterium]|nr:hypothetical protein [Acidimicrobiia bacterium]